MKDLRTWRERWAATYGMSQDLHSVQTRGTPEAWDDELDGSRLLRDMIRRRDEKLAELGEDDEDTAALIVLLRRIEQDAKAFQIEHEQTIRACFDRLAWIGPPEPDEWEDREYRFADYWER